VTPIENLMSPQPTAQYASSIQNPGPRPVAVKSSTTYAEATCLDAAGHVVACSVCKKLETLERVLCILVSAVISSLVTAILLWRFYKRSM
jgi:hypothetical protein